MGRHSANSVVVGFGKQYKALIAFIVPLIAFVTFIATNPTITAALGGPATTWLLSVGVPALTYALTFLKRNEPTILAAQEALDRAQARGI